MKVTRTNQTTISFKTLEFTINKNGEIDLFDTESEININIHEIIKNHFEHGDVVTVNIVKKDVDMNIHKS